MIVLLDVMGTIVTEPFWEDIPAFFGMTMKELLALKHPSSWVEFEHGRLSEEEYLASFFADGRPVDGDAFKAMIFESYDFIPGLQPILTKLRDSPHPVHALSNYPVWYQIIEQKLELSRYLKWSFVSCLTGARKPDPEAYLVAPRQLGVTPEECLFIDDRQVNVDAARAVGMKAERFVDAAQLEADLARHGIFTE